MHSAIHINRAFILVVSIAIITLSLSVYSIKTIPIFSLFTESHQLRGNDDYYERAALLEMVQDRRLISTLVAAQASVFCPLFLLLINYQTPTQSRPMETSRMELVCQILLPLGLALSWLFSICFDRKTTVAANVENSAFCLYGADSQWACRAITGAHLLKYVVFLALLLEVGLVSFHGLCSEPSKKGSIRLLDDEEQANVLEKA